MMESLFDSTPIDLSVPSDPQWGPLVKGFLASPQGQCVVRHLEEAQKAGDTIYPPLPFRAFELTPFKEVRVVILGQDPYHGEGQAEGLAFSVPEGVKVPPSLRNMKKEIALEYGLEPTKNGSLLSWAEQGVLLLNAVMTVKKQTPAAHSKWGWQRLSDEVIRLLSEEGEPMVFMLWGNFAKEKRALINESRHLVLTANHPSPLSATKPPEPFIGCGHFKKANDWLIAKGRAPIEWVI